MGEITYVAGSSLKLDHELGQKVFDVVRASSLGANDVSKTHPSEGLEASFEEYKAENVWHKVNPLIESYFAFDGDRLVGTAFLSDQECTDLPKGEGAYLAGLYVHPEYWGRKVASILLDKVKYKARETGIKSIRGNTTTFPQTMKFYEKHGFELGEPFFWEVLPDVKLKYFRMELTVGA